MKRFRLRPLMGILVVCLVLVFSVVLGGELSRAATLKLTGEGVTIEYKDGSGATVQETIPVHQTGNAKYFSAGVGLEERSAHYPPFPLKLVFVAGPKAYLSQVSVTITGADGKNRLEVPREQVVGPWLFVDLPTGTYDVSAEGPGKARINERVTIDATKGKTVYLRWKGETS